MHREQMYKMNAQNLYIMNIKMNTIYVYNQNQTRDKVMKSSNEIMYEMTQII